MKYVLLFSFFNLFTLLSILFIDKKYLQFAKNIVNFSE